MFLAVNIDLASSDSENNVIKVINEYGIKKLQSNLFESFEFPSNKLGNFKRDLSNCLDMYDRIRLYQYPLENAFKISYFEKGKWKRLSIK
jgi:CRISPR-associated protein Cas2